MTGTRDDPSPPHGGEQAPGPLVRPFADGDEEAVNRGFNAVFGLARPLAEWRWKFPPGPDGRRFIELAEEGGEVVAHYAAQAVPVQVDGRTLLGGHIADAYARPRTGLARRGVYTRTVEAFYDTFCGPGGLAFTFGFPGHRHMRLGRRQLRYCAPRPVPRLERPLAPARPAGAWARWRRRRAGLALAEGLDGARADGLWRRAAGRHPVAARRDARRLAERWTGRPGADVLHLTVLAHGAPAAWAAAVVEGDLLRWADLVWDGTPGALEALDGALAERGRARGAGRGELWLGNDPAAEAILGRRGWRPAPHPEGLEMTAVSFTPGLDAGDLVARFYLTLGDSDLV